MKTLFAILILGMTSLNAIFAQNKIYPFSIYGGMTPPQTPNQPALIMNREDAMNEFLFNLKTVERSFLIGGQKKFQFSEPFFGILGLQFQIQQLKYTTFFTHRESPPESGLNLTSAIVSLPAGVGVQMNHLDVSSGFLMKLSLKENMQDRTQMNIGQNPSGVEMGWYTGVGYTIDRMRMGVQFQSSLRRYGHQLNYNQHSMELMRLPGQFAFTLSYAFGSSANSRCRYPCRKW